MKNNLFVIFLLVSGVAEGQTSGATLRDINYNYLYNPEEKFSFDLKPVRLSGGWKILYAFHSSDTSTHASEFNIEWQGRDGLSTSESVNFSDKVDNGVVTSKNGFAGSLTIPFSEAPKVIVAKVINTLQKKAWIFSVTLEEKYPVNNYLVTADGPITKSYFKVGKSLSFAERRESWVVSYYNDNFPAGAPAFSEAQAKVPRVIKADSVFQLFSDTIRFFSKGIFLFQEDTLQSDGFALRAENDFPRYTLVQNLPGPLIYICTKQEYDKLELAKADKKTFDRTVLTITGNTERAKKLMRNYFRRVELANLYFTSYKEGWKTDRGMIYIIFGLPNEVYKFFDREVWKYKNELFDITFNFTKSTSVFDPDNYVLIRDNKYKETWYEVIDLWRNARF